MIVLVEEICRGILLAVAHTNFALDSTQVKPPGFTVMMSREEEMGTMMLFRLKIFCDIFGI